MADTNVGTLSSEEPLINLRWKSGVLEQQWKIVNYENNEPFSMDLVWRPVPEATDD